jgi:hypothetical protein
METASQYREFLNLSPWFTAKPWATAAEGGVVETWNQTAERKVQELLVSEYESPLSFEQEREIDAIVEEAERHLRLDAGA